MKKLYIVRGVSGSGKSYLAAQLVSNPDHIGSADDFFMVEGQYCYDRGKICQAHQYCKDRIEQLMKDGVSPIATDNTFTRPWEARHYLQLAGQHGYEVEICEPDTAWKSDPEELARRNQHGLSIGIIKQIMARYVPMSQYTIEAIQNSREPGNRNDQTARPN